MYPLSLSLSPFLESSFSFSCWPLNLSLIAKLLTCCY